jgi:hypothetical protein
MVLFLQYLSAAIQHNMQMLPESIVCGLVILSIALANPTLFALAAGTVGVQAFTGGVGRIMMNFQPESAVLMSATDPCRRTYLGMSWESLLSGVVKPEQLWHPAAPSVYSATVAFITGYGLALQLIYKEEINAGMLNATWMTIFGVIAAFILLLVIVFRSASGMIFRSGPSCESLVSVLGGVFLGLLIGFLGTVSLAYMTDRKATNIWGIPLLRDRINAGAPVYVCEQ